MESKISETEEITRGGSTTQDAHVFSVPNTAQYLGLTTEELEAVIESGLLPVIQPTDKVLIHEADLEAYVHSSLIAAKGPSDARD